MPHERDLGGPAERALVASLVRGDAGEAAAHLRSGDVGARRLLRVADRQRIGARFHHAVRALGLADELPDGVAAWTRQRAMEQWALAQRLLAELDRLWPHVEAVAPRAVVVGGPVLSHRLHADAGRRGADLLHLLVERGDVAALVRRLTRLNYVDVTQGGPVRAQLLLREGTVLLGNEVPVLVSWSVPGLGAGPRAAMLDRAVRHSATQVPVRVLTLEDELARVALATLQDLQLGDGRLRALVDVLDLADALDREEREGWTGRCARWDGADLTRVVTGMLLLSRDVLGWVGRHPDLDAGLDARARQLAPTAPWLGLRALAPAAPDDRARARALEHLEPGGPVVAVRNRAVRGGRRLAAASIARAVGAGRRVAEVHLGRGRIERDRTELQTPLAPLPRPHRPGEIFVVLAAHRDPEAQRTIDDLFEQAAHPERVSVGVVWQVDPHVDADCVLDPSAHAERIRVREIPAARSLGVCFARYEAQRLWRGEEYVLHIDSHSRFLPGWDEACVAELAACPSPKPYLTGYPGAYRLDEPLPPKAVAFGIQPWQFFDDVLRLHAGAAASSADEPEPTPFVAGGFAFARAELIAEVPYDPYLGYEEEEVSYGARLFTHGWDGFVIRQGQVFHLYGDDKPRTQRTRTGIVHPDAVELARRSCQRYRHLFGFEASHEAAVIADLDRFGLGPARTLDDFEEAAGIELWTRSIRRPCAVPAADDASAPDDATTGDPDGALAPVVALPLERPRRDDHPAALAGRPT